MFDVAIVGAGPSGAMAARLLGEKGFRVALLEEHQQPGDPVNCSGIIGVEAFERFDLPRDLIIRSIHLFRFFAPGGATLPYNHPEPLAYAVNRSEFDVRLAQKAVHSGVELKTGKRVTAVRIDPDCVELELNRREKIVARFVVVATGAGSRLTEQIGLGRPSKYVLGAQAEVDTIALDEVEIYLGSYVSPANFGWVIPLQEGRAKIGLIADENGREALRKFLFALGDRVQTKHPPIRCSLLPLQTIARTYTDRALVIGEAAGQIKTITCGGIYYGLLAAEIAAEVLESALHRSRYDAAALSNYEQRWRELLGRELRIGLRMRRVFEKFTDENIDALFELAHKDGLMKLIRDKANFDWHHDLIISIFKHSLVRALLSPIVYSRLVVS